MQTGVTRDGGGLAFAEMREFASFPAGTQRYIRRALDIAFNRGDVVDRWSRDMVEAASIKAQMRVYERITDLRRNIPEDTGLEQVEKFMAPLIAVTSFDLGQGRLDSFAAYRFLYERLLGASARPWLPGAFCGAAALPSLHPEKRKDLLQSISEAAATAHGWSGREPTFLPEWVDKIEPAGV